MNETPQASSIPQLIIQTINKPLPDVAGSAAPLEPTLYDLGDDWALTQLSSLYAEDAISLKHKPCGRNFPNWTLTMYIWEDDMMDNMVCIGCNARMPRELLLKAQQVYKMVAKKHL